ncbi:DUF58 domain-containing protein [Puniceicoccus vermicola]|uniref:DUF58 domain-containing protein n=1 Tax=Puniceicoccus vermicola TaxID=388746 RepID=A0A7X1B2C9_9BACT|nr:DUF58 domain-containing protein [Puniceicoccus vermicola]MBC2604343.1 DUF58 domain-containing protein [Puniceicoccus vermicola]
MPTLALRARYLVEGFISGKHRSPLTGHSVDFSEYRAYQTGDEFRAIDWRLYGRTNRLSIKVYEDETQLNACLVLDCSASLAYQSREPLMTKLDYARTCLAALSLLIKRQGDASGLAIISDDIDHYLPASARPSRFYETCQRLDAIEASPDSAFARNLGRLSELLKQRSLVVIASDFYEEPEHLLRVLNRLRFDGHDVIGLQVLDPAEIEFDLEEPGQFMDLEQGQMIALSPEEIRESYLQHFRAFQGELRREFVDAGFELITLRTDQSPMEALSLYLARRL